MSFVISRSSTYRWPIKIRLPKDGGGFTVETFEGDFNRLKQSRIEEIMRQSVVEDADNLAGDGLSIGDVVREILAGWSGILDGDGDEIPFSDKDLADVLEIPTVGMQILKAWGESLKGGAEGARGKN